MMQQGRSKMATIALVVLAMAVLVRLTLLWLS